MIKSLFLLRLKPMSTKGDRSQKDKSAPKRAPPAPGPGTFTGRVLRVVPGVRSHPRPLLKGRGLPGPPGARAAAGPGVLRTAVLIKDPKCRVLRPQLRAQPASGRGREGGQWAESRGSGSSRGAGGCGVDLAPSCIVSTSPTSASSFWDGEDGSRSRLASTAALHTASLACKSPHPLAVVVT